MKVIDLLIKIANGELSFEQEFKYNGVITNIDMFSDEYLLNEEVLSFEIELVEIIEEDKEMEDIDKEMSKLQSEIDLLSNEIGSYHNEIHSMRDRNNYMKETLKDLRIVVNELKKGN